MVGLSWKTLVRAGLASAVVMVSAGGLAASPSDPLALRDHLYMPHFAKAAGIYEALDLRGDEMSQELRQKGVLTQAIHADYAGPAAAAVTAAYWEGREEGEVGRWSVTAFEAYVDRVRRADEQIFVLTDDAARAFEELGLSAAEAQLRIGEAIGRSLPASGAMDAAAQPGSATDPAVLGVQRQVAEIVMDHLALAGSLDDPDMVGSRIAARGAIAGEQVEPGLVSWAP